MATVNIFINQVGAPSGYAGISRDDLSTSKLTTLTNVNRSDLAITSYKWKFLSWAKSDPTDSPPELSGADGYAATFTPLVEGTYIMQLTVNSKIKGTIGVAIKTSLLDIRLPSGSESNQFNGGWEWALSEALTTLEAYSGGSGGPPSGTASGDLDGTYPGPRVDGLQGRDVANTAPTDGQVLTWDTPTSQWRPETSPSGVTTFIALTDTPGSYSGQQDKLVAVNGAADALIFVSGAAPSGAASGDLAGTYPGPTVDGLQGRDVASTAPTDGQVLTWDTPTSQWRPETSPSGVTTFVALTDTPASYVARAGAILRVNSNPNALEFVSGTSNGQVLTWSSASNFWYPAAPTGGGGDGYDFYDVPLIPVDWY